MKRRTGCEERRRKAEVRISPLRPDAASCPQWQASQLPLCPLRRRVLSHVSCRVGGWRFAAEDARWRERGEAILCPALSHCAAKPFASSLGQVFHHFVRLPASLILFTTGAAPAA